MARNKRGIKNKHMSEHHKKYLKSKNSNYSWFSDGNSNEVIHSAITKSECLSASSKIKLKQMA